MPRGRRKKAFRVKLKPTTLYTFSSLLLFVLAALLILSFSGRGIVLNQVNQLMLGLFGWTAIFLPFLLVIAGLMLFRLKWRVSHPNVLVGGLLVFFGSLGLTRAGRIGFELWLGLTPLVSALGSILIFIILSFIGFVIAFNTSLEEMIVYVSQLFNGVKQKGVGFKSKGTLKPNFADNKSKFDLPSDSESEGQKKDGKGKQEDSAATLELEKKAATNLPSEGQDWRYPPLSLLSAQVSTKADRGDVKKNAEVIEKTLESFGIATQVSEVNYGPAVTQYALEIALGTKLSKITSLANDMALALAAPTGQIRIEAPIPGRSLVGVEVPNRTPEFVGMKKMLSSDEVKKHKSKLAVGLGLDVSGQPRVTDLATLPHILIAGATGSGKSVAINSFITTILFRASPAEVKFILVDPKRVELTQYDGIPHLMTPVIVDPKNVLSALKWAVSEMDRRYKLFAEVGARNIAGYNEISGFSALPFLLIVVDELADIMLFAPAEVEDTICRIAQMARATGIHLIISTQRPSVDVITGLIKANIPCRLAFNVSSQIDSRVILDTPGAEKLLGKGDMLFIPPDQAKPSRIQGTFVSDKETQALIKFIKETGVAPQYTEEVTEMADKKITPSGKIASVEEAERDEFFDQAIEVICRDKRASASLLQRRLKLGYARAARIIDQLEAVGIVGSPEGSKSREVLISSPQDYFDRRQNES